MIGQKSESGRGQYRICRKMQQRRRKKSLKQPLLVKPSCLYCTLYSEIIKSLLAASLTTINCFRRRPFMFTVEPTNLNVL